MIIRLIPILFIYKICVAVKVELIHSEYDRKIFWLPLNFLSALPDAITDKLTNELSFLEHPDN